MQDQGNLAIWLGILSTGLTSLAGIITLIIKIIGDRKQKKLEGENARTQTQLEGDYDIHKILATNAADMDRRWSGILDAQKLEFERQIKVQSEQMEREIKITNKRVAALEEDLKKSENDRKKERVYFEEVIEKKENLIESLEVELEIKENKLVTMQDMEKIFKEAKAHNELLLQQNDEQHWEIDRLENTIKSLEKTIEELHKKIDVLKEGVET